jgi:arylsulfatase A
VTDRLAEEAVRFIDRHRDRPFFLYLAHFAVHTPIQGRADLVAKYQRKLRDGLTHRNAAYAAMTESLDAAVGRVVTRLDELNLRERTIVVFTSDNGGRITQGTTSNAPLRYGKASAYEGGVRVPLIIAGPGVAPAGRVSHAPVITMDLFPTLVELAGLPGAAARSALDGVSLASHLRGGPAPARDALFWHYPHHQHYQLGGAMPYAAIRAGDFKLIEFFHDLKEPKLELYNLRTDIGETTDLAAAEPRRVADLRARLHAWQGDVGAQLPTPNPNYDPFRPEYTPPPPKAKKTPKK